MMTLGNGEGLSGNKINGMERINHYKKEIV